MAYAQIWDESFRSWTQFTFLQHETWISMNSMYLPSLPIWPHSISEFCLPCGGQQLTPHSTFQLLLSAALLKVFLCIAYQRLAKNLRGIYTQILKFLLLWLPPHQDFFTQFPAPVTALNSAISSQQHNRLLLISCCSVPFRLESSLREKPD